MYILSLLFTYFSKLRRIGAGPSQEENAERSQANEKYLPGFHHRLRPIDTHLALYTMLYNNSAKNRYAEPILNKTKQISKIRD